MASSQPSTIGQTFVPPGLASLKLTAAKIKTTWHTQSFADKSAVYYHNSVFPDHVMQTHRMLLLDGLFVLISRRAY
jgi:hypothetical protein